MRNENYKFLRQKMMNETSHTFPSLATFNGGPDKNLWKMSEESKGGSYKKNKAKAKTYPKRSQLLTIGGVASFDDFTEAISEFYNECRTKVKIESNILSNLLYKLNKKQTKFNKSHDMDEQESTASDSLAVYNNEIEMSKSLPHKRKPKRRTECINTSIHDIL